MDWVHCNTCFFQPGHQPKREFILTSCGHIFCRCCERSGTLERCKICGISCTTTTLSAQMVDAVQAYFEDPESSLGKIAKVMEFQKSHRLKLIEFYRKVWEKYQALKGSFQSLKNGYQKLEEENKKLRKTNMELTRDLEACKNQSSVLTPPPPSPLFCQNSQAARVIRMQSQSSGGRPDSPFFVTPTRPVYSSLQYRSQNFTPSTPMSNGSSISPSSVTSEQSYRSANSGRSNIQYRSNVTPPVNRLNMLSVNPQRDRNLSSRY